MVLQIIAQDYRTISRNVSPKNIHTYVEGFLMLRSYNKWGKLYILKGNERKLIREFGKK